MHTVVQNQIKMYNLSTPSQRLKIFLKIVSTYSMSLINLRPISLTNNTWVIVGLQWVISLYIPLLFCSFTLSFEPFFYRSLSLTVELGKYVDLSLKSKPSTPSKSSNSFVVKLPHCWKDGPQRLIKNQLFLVPKTIS